MRAGGLSFFSPRYGLVCDNVENFEVVLASGKLVNANAREHSDLWFALRGGSNNFGVVTRFDLRTFEQGPFWGGIVVYPMDDREEHFVLFEKFNREAESDEYAALIINYSYDQDNGWIVANNYEYTKPEPYPAVFEAFTSIQPQLYSTMRVSNLSDFTVEIAENTDDLRRYVNHRPSHVPIPPLEGGPLTNVAEGYLLRPPLATAPPCSRRSWT